jgi:serine protease Do
MRRGSGFRRLALVLAGALPVALLPMAAHASPKAKDKRPAQAGGSLLALSRQFRDLVNRVSPSVVEIEAQALAPLPGRGTEGLLGTQERGGSGVVLSADGYIVTNAHVVEGARDLQVMLARPAAPEAPAHSILRPQSQRLTGRVVGVDSETDLAVIKVDADRLPHLELGDSDGLSEGDLVLAFGSPFGFQNSVTMGVVSAVGRQLRPEDPMVYIQTDTPINPGNSGGPLVDAEGRVVGINTLIYSRSGGSEGIGFAAPSNIVRSVFDQLRAYGRVRRGAIGVYAQTITPTLAAGLGLKQRWGVILGDVHPNSPAAGAGLREGDIVLTLDGKAMENGRQFDVNLYRRMAGDSATISVLRGNEHLVFRVPVIPREDDPTRIPELVKSERSLVGRLGVLAVDVDEKIAPSLPWLRGPEGVLIVAQAADAPPVDTGLQPGDVILAVNHSPVRSLEGLTGFLAAMKKGDPIALEIDRLGRRQYLAIEAP